MWSKGGLFAASLAIITSCGSSGQTATDGSADSRTDAAETVIPCRSGDEFAQSHQPFDPCATDSDCHHPFLECAQQTVESCNGIPRPQDTGCPSPFPADLPICPETARISVRLCAVRYQEPCVIDSDCGPGGFVCTRGACQEQGGGLCETESDCPQGWDCFAPCPCASRDAAEHRGCYAPFTMLHCPLCVIGTIVEEPPLDAGVTD
jgi:hypothetical protein